MLISGNGVNSFRISFCCAVDKLTAFLPQERREFFLRLMVTFGLEESNPLLPIFVGLQFYVEYLEAVLGDMRMVVRAFKQELPAELRTAADESPGKAVSAYGDIQKQIDSSPAVLAPGFPPFELLAGYSVSFTTIFFYSWLGLKDGR